MTVEVVVAGLPEGPAGLAYRDGKLDGLNSLCQSSALRLAEKQVHMLGHDDIAVDGEPIAPAHRLQRVFEQVARRRRVQMRKAAVTTERDEVKAAALLVTMET